jgi:hypothetical protein
MANFVKAPVLSDLIKFEQPDLLGREKAKITSTLALKIGTVLQGTPAAATPWDLTDPEDIYGILLTEVPAGSTALPVTVLFAGPATINPAYLVWDNAATATNKNNGLAKLKKANFVFERRAATDTLYPSQIDRV